MAQNSGAVSILKWVLTIFSMSNMSTVLPDSLLQLVIQQVRSPYLLLLDLQCLHVCLSVGIIFVGLTNPVVPLISYSSIPTGSSHTWEWRKTMQLFVDVPRQQVSCAVCFACLFTSWRCHSFSGKP